MTANKSKKVVAKNKKHLKQLIDERLARFGNRCDLNDIDVSQITDMSDLFNGLIFKGDVSEWDVSNVRNMMGMFEHTEFNGDISKWNVSRVREISFRDLWTPINGDISN